MTTQNITQGLRVNETTQSVDNYGRVAYGSMTQAEINALSGLVSGSTVYNETVGSEQIRNGLSRETVATFEDINNNTSIIISSGATTVFTIASKEKNIITGTAENEAINLGNATTYNVGKSYKLISSCTAVVSILNGGVVEIGRLEPYNTMEFSLIDNTTVGGVRTKNTVRATEDKATSYYEEWVTTSVTTGRLTSGAGGGATAVISGAFQNRRGVISVNCGTTATGRFTVRQNATNMLFGQNKSVVYETSVLVDTLSTATDRFIFQVGYGDSTAATENTDGAWFEYNEGLNGNFWKLRTANNFALTSVVTTIPVVAGAWVKLRLECNRAGTVMKYFIDNIFVGSINTNIPTAVARQSDIILKLQKTAGVFPRLVYQDYVSERNYYDR